MTRSDQPKPPAVAIVRQNGLSSASCMGLSRCNTRVTTNLVDPGGGWSTTGTSPLLRGPVTIPRLGTDSKDLVCLYITHPMASAGIIDFKKCDYCKSSKCNVSEILLSYPTPSLPRKVNRLGIRGYFFNVMRYVNSRFTILTLFRPVLCYLSLCTIPKSTCCFSLYIQGGS